MKILFLDALVFGSVLQLRNSFDYVLAPFLEWAQLNFFQVQQNLWWHINYFYRNCYFHLATVCVSYLRENNCPFLNLQANWRFGSCLVWRFSKYEFQRKSFQKRKPRLLFCLHFNHFVLNKWFKLSGGSFSQPEKTHDCSARSRESTCSLVITKFSRKIHRELQKYKKSKEQI